MTDARELRRQAARCRRAAAIRTEGASMTDRQLIALAESLEAEAQRLEAATAPKLPRQDPPTS
jgi:hypothetical protein